MIQLWAWIFLAHLYTALEHSLDRSSLFMTVTLWHCLQLGATSAASIAQAATTDARERDSCTM